MNVWSASLIIMKVWNVYLAREKLVHDRFEHKPFLSKTVLIIP